MGVEPWETGPEESVGGLCIGGEEERRTDLGLIWPLTLKFNRAIS